MSAYHCREAEEFSSSFPLGSVPEKAREAKAKELQKPRVSVFINGNGGVTPGNSRSAAAGYETNLLVINLRAGLRRRHKKSAVDKNERENCTRMRFMSGMAISVAAFRRGLNFVEIFLQNIYGPPFLERCGAKSSFRFLAHHGGRAVNRFAHPGAGAATANRVRHDGVDHLIARIGMLAEQSAGAENLSRLAESALGDIFFHPGLPLARMTPLG